jgi:HK97 family phage major capsid protein
MADKQLAELQEKKNAAAIAIKELAGRQDKWTAEDRTQWDAVNADYDAASAGWTARKEELTNSEAIQARLKQIEDEGRLVNKDRRIGPDEERRREESPERRAAAMVDSQALALQAWTCTRQKVDDFRMTEAHQAACKLWGVDPRSDEIGFGDTKPIYSRKAAWQCSNVPTRREVRVGLDISTSGAGMETVPEGFMPELARVTLEYAHVSNVCRILSTASGNPIPWPKVDDTSNTGVMLSAATTIGTSVDPTFSAVTFSSYKMSSKAVFVANELLQDSAFNMSTELASMLGERLGRIEGSYSTTGTGTSEPKGIVTCAGTGVTSAVATVFTADELIDLVHSLDISNRGGSSVGFMMHDTAVKYVRKFKDANGQYLWQSGMGAGSPDTLYGYPVVTNQAMEPLVSNIPVTAKKHVLFGDFSKFIVRYAGGIRFYHLTERYRDTDQDGFVAFRRFDSNTIKASALKVLLQA